MGADKTGCDNEECFEFRPQHGVPINMLVGTALQAEASKAPEFVTPELALVDPVLAANERARLPDPRDMSSPLSEWSQPLSTNGTALVSAVVPRAAVPANASDSTLAGIRRLLVARIPVRRAGRPARPKLLVGAVVFSVVVAALLADRTLGPDMRVPPTRFAEGSVQTMSNSGPGAPGTPLTTAGSGGRKGPTTPRLRAGMPAAQPRRFAWAPVSGASGYRVEFYRGPDRVFAANTTRAEVVIPATWASSGLVHRLDPGEYLWYVWPIVRGKRALTAVVQAKLRVA